MPARWNETVALFGGRFDPPHLGHAEAVRGLFRYPGVKEVWIIPSPTPPHKAATASFEHRLEMTKLAFSKMSSVKLDLREAERAKRRPDLPTYTYDTLQEIRREIPHLAFVIGVDQLEQLHTWHRFPELLELCHWIVLGREPNGLARGQKVLSQWKASGIGAKATVLLAPTEAPELSSTEIREEIALHGEVPKNSLDPDVLVYLKQNRLYGTESHQVLELYDVRKQNH